MGSDFSASLRLQKRGKEGKSYHKCRSGCQKEILCIRRQQRKVSGSAYSADGGWKASAGWSPRNQTCGCQDCYSTPNQGGDQSSQEIAEAGEECLAPAVQR